MLQAGAEEHIPRRSISSAIAITVRRHPWWIVGVALVLFSVGLVRLTNTRPGYDPYGWLVWGYQTLRLHLDLGGAPSWKPLTFLFDVPYALFGSFALWLWMVTAVAVALAGSIFAGRIAYRLTINGSERRYPAIAAAAFAGVALLGIQDYAHYVLSVQSDPMIVTFCLAAIDCFLSGRYRWVLAFGVLASLGRPEAWPFVGLYAIWAWRRVPSMRWLILAELAVIPALWFGVPTITNHRPFVAGQLAQLSPRALHQGKVIGTMRRFVDLQYLPVELAALVTLALAIVRRHPVVLILAAGVIGWVLVEIAFALHGWPAVPRYLFPPAGVMIVLAGVAVGWILTKAPPITRLPQAGAIALVVLLSASLVPGAVTRLRTEHRDLRHERERTVEINLLQSTVERLGGYQHIRYCGEPVTSVGYVSILAWFTKLDIGFVGHRPKYELHQKYPIVMFTPLPHGWGVQTYRTPAARQASCAGLNALYVRTPSHPQGLLVPH